MADLSHPAILTAEETCGACPVQWEGTLTDGGPFYFRYRFATASLARTPDSPEVSMPFGDHRLDGIFESDEDRDRVFAELHAQLMLMEAEV